MQPWPGLNAADHGLQPHIDVKSDRRLSIAIVAGLCGAALIALLVADGGTRTGVTVVLNEVERERGVWIWRLSQVEGGDLRGAVRRLSDTQTRWVTIKAGDSDAFIIGRNEITLAAVREFQRAGIRVLAWHFIYCRDVYHVPDITEADVALRILETPGVEGLIVDAEADCEGEPEAAASFMRAVRAQHPNAFIAYTTFPIIGLHTTFPYLEFARYADAAMPQAYWKDLGLSPSEMILRVEEQWGRWYERWEEEGFTESIKPVIPVAQGYDVSGPELAEYCDASREYGYEGLNIFRYETMTPSAWNAFADCGL